MHHENHDTGGCTKCIINTRQIAPLAKALADVSGLDAAARLGALATAANVLYGMYGPVGLLPSEPCEHAVKLVHWLQGTEITDADEERLNIWCDEILEDIAEMVGAAGKGPSK